MLIADFKPQGDSIIYQELADWEIGAAEEFGESTNAIRIELNRFEQAGLLTSITETNKKVFRANESHPMYKEINRMVKKYPWLDQIVEQLAGKLGNIRKAYLTGNISIGLPSDDI